MWTATSRKLHEAAVRVDKNVLVREMEDGEQRNPYGNTDEVRTHIVGKRELYKEKWNVLVEDTRTIDRRNMEKFDTLHSDDKTIAVLGDRWRSQTTREETNKIKKQCCFML